MSRRVRANDTTKAFEEALSQPSTDYYLLRLYVTGSTPRSARAIRHIRAICETKLQGRYELEVIDVHQNPTQIRPDQIVVTPTLVKRLPLPVRKIVGDLSNVERVLVGLDIRSSRGSGAAT